MISLIAPYLEKHQNLNLELLEAANATPEFYGGRLWTVGLARSLTAI